MHSNLSITDGVYGILSSEDVGNKIKSLGDFTDSTLSKNEMIRSLENILQVLKKDT